MRLRLWGTPPGGAFWNWRTHSPAPRALQSDHAHGFAGNDLVGRIVAVSEQRCALTLRKLSAPASRDDEGSASPQ